MVSLYWDYCEKARRLSETLPHIMAVLLSYIAFFYFLFSVIFIVSKNITIILKS